MNKHSQETARWLSCALSASILFTLSYQRIGGGAPEFIADIR